MNRLWHFLLKRTADCGLSCRDALSQQACAGAGSRGSATGVRGLEARFGVSGSAARFATCGLAAPAGGLVERWGRGCATTFSLAMYLALSSPATAATQDVYEPISVPSGMEVSFLELVWDERGQAGLTYRFRFVAPAVRDLTYSDVAADMEHLCNAFAVPRISTDVGPRPSQIIVSLSAEATDFGEAQPDIVQYFEAFRLEGDLCVWELF